MTFRFCFKKVSFTLKQLFVFNDVVPICCLELALPLVADSWDEFGVYNAKDILEWAVWNQLESALGLDCFNGLLNIVVFLHLLWCLSLDAKLSLHFLTAILDGLIEGRLTLTKDNRTFLGAAVPHEV